ncbi:MAG TPA: hypothetical protein VJ691_01725 [Vicinamibacterales bacterium]|nr:hypothetical protein [Vicinamibacterales bacterium]
MPPLAAGVAAGIGLGVLYAASPLFAVTLAGAAALLIAAGRELPSAERRRIVIILGAALAVRFLLIAGLLVVNIPYLSDLGVGGLRGDDAYYLARAIRARDIMLGVTQGRYDYFVVTDEYGRTSYLHFLTFIQVLFGPSPYSMRALNSLLFVTGSYLLFRMCRPGLGATATSLALVALLFLPSLLVSSMSTSKEPLYFFITTVLLTAALAVIRHPSVLAKLAAIGVAAVALWILDDLRRGALVLGLSGLALAALARLLLATPRRAAASVAVALITAAILWTQQPVRERFLDVTAGIAKMHAGHVFTPGHAYKLLDEGFYMHPGTPAAWVLDLSERQAGRFLVRAAASFVATPLPWEMRSTSELMFFPEHLLWMLIVVLVPIGAVAGWRRDATITACLIGFAVPTAAAIAMTTGNIGTLLRLRGLVTPYLLWFAALGALTVYEWLLTRPASVPRHAEAAS